MVYLVGVFVAVGVAALARLSGMDRDRAFYPAVAIVVASYYALFAAMGASNSVLGAESAIAVAFTVLAVIGFRRSPWVVAAAIAGHGVFDLVHHWLVANPGVPVWWPGFCATVDILLGAWVAARLVTSDWACGVYQEHS